MEPEQDTAVDSGVGRLKACCFMSADEYRRYARDCFNIAETISDSRYRLALIDMAQSWSRLAQQAEKNLTTDLVYETPTPSGEAGGRHVAQQQQQVQPKKDE